MAQPTSIDFLTPFDPTGYTSITGAQLQQLVGGVYPNTGIGLIVVSADVAGVPTVPNANTTTKWQNYLWIRQSSTFVTVYVWNPGGASDATYLNWVTLSSASIGAGTIQGYQIANQTITSANIHDVASSLITGATPAAWIAQLNIGQTAYATNGLLTTSMSLFGDLTGSTLGVPTIGSAAITLAKMAKQSVAGNSTAGQGNIIDNSITNLQLLSTGATASTPLNNPAGAVDPWNNIIVPTTSIIGIPGAGSATQAVAAGDILAVAYGRQGYKTVNRAILNLADPTSETYDQAIIVAANGTAYSFVDKATLSRILQQVNSTDSSKSTSAGNLVGTATLPNYNATGMTSWFSFAFTPISATSKLHITGVLYVGSNTNAAYTVAGVYPSNGATAPSVFAYNQSAGNSGTMIKQIVIDGWINSPGTAAMTFYVAFGCNIGAAYTNSIDGATTLFGGTAPSASSITVTEYL